MTWEEREHMETEARMETCPICRKRFLPAPEHYWKIGYDKRGSENNYQLVCTYSCMRKWEKEKFNKTKEGIYASSKSRWNPGRSKPIIAINIETGEETLYSSISAARRSLNLTYYDIKKIAKGELDNANGFRFKFDK